MKLLFFTLLFAALNTALTVPTACHTDQYSYDYSYDLTNQITYTCATNKLITFASGILKSTYSYGFSSDGATYTTCYKDHYNLAGAKAYDDNGGQYIIQLVENDSGEYTETFQNAIYQGTGTVEKVQIFKIVGKGELADMKSKINFHCTYTWYYNFNTWVFDYQESCQPNFDTSSC